MTENNLRYKICLSLQGDGEGDGGGSNILSLLGPLSGSLSGVRTSF